MENSNKIIIGIVIIVIAFFLYRGYNETFSIVGGQTTCYQESANIATACGGLNIGSYSGNFAGDGSLWRDGDWNTYSYSSDGGETVYVTYAKPTGALSNSLWQVKDKLGVVNLSPGNCVRDNLQLKIYSKDLTSGNSIVEWSCYDGANWIILRSFYDNNGGTASHWVYEEAMIWNICTESVDTNCDGIVTRAELGTTINSWISGTVTRANLGAAIQAWAN